MRTILLLTALLLSFAAPAQIGATRIKRQLETSNPAEFQLNLRWGETVDFDLQFLSHGTAMDITGATVTLHAVTNGMPTGTSFQMAGTAGSSGSVSFRIVVDEWLPYGLTTGTWTIECAQVSDGRIMRASGVLKCSGIYYPSAISPLPITWATNLWLAISGLQAKTNDWNAAFGWGDHALQGYLAAESDPGIPVHNTNETAHASLLAGKVSATDSVYTDTVARASSALQAESDPLVAGHIKLITEGQIANWNSSTGAVEAVGDSVSWSPISTLATGAVITLTWDGTNAIDYAEVSQPFTLTNAFTVALNNTTNFYKKGWIRAIATNALVNTIWDSRIEWDQGTPDLTCTGLYKFVFSSADGIKIQARQEWPKVNDVERVPFVIGPTAGNSALAHVALGAVIMGNTVTNNMLYFNVPNNQKYYIAKIDYQFNNAASTTNLINVFNGYWITGIEGSMTTNAIYSFSHTANNGTLTRHEKGWFIIPPIPLVINSGALTFQLSRYVRHAFYYNRLGPTAGDFIINSFSLREATTEEIKAYAQGWRPQ